MGAVLQGLQQTGWSIGQNVRIDTRWATSNTAGIHKHAAELAALAPDIILAHGAWTVAPLLQATRSVPIVSPVFGDPVRFGFVDSLARPGGNVTGFVSFEYSMAAAGMGSCTYPSLPTQSADATSAKLIRATAPRF